MLFYATYQTACAEPQDWGNHMDFLKFFITTEDKVLETISCRIFATIK